ncbi:MAG TPA: DNA cytosine methyltransferase [Candidatus Hydrogenedentes bacterium]|nr:DNA cytosine methyltransferase [Candidatus Hydrogenedentota bacterium]HNT86953.1 DNA cytosine methyltransferase [Candidatus Hydrogenedentota bacterium]
MVEAGTAAIHATEATRKPLLFKDIEPKGPKMVDYSSVKRITRPMMVREEEAVYHAREKGSLFRTRTPPRLIDLFCGAGGMTLGFTKLCGHCFEPVWANDFNHYAANTYNANFGTHCIEGDINDILEDPSITHREAARF